MNNTKYLSSENNIKPLLTIGIPIFNGGEYLTETLDSIVNQIDQSLLNKIEIIISDNASEDDTKKVSLDYCNNYKYIKYFENNENVGFDRNIDLIFKRSSGDLVWLLGDDDEIKHGAIRKVLDLILLKPELSVILVNYDTKPIDSNSGYKIFTNSEDFIYNSMFKMGFLSSNIIKRNNWNMVNSSIYFDSGWIHIGVILEILSIKDRNSAIISDYLVIMGRKKKAQDWGKKGSFVNMGLDLVDILKNRMPELKYSKKVTNFLVSEHKRGYYWTIPLAKAKGLRFNKLLFRRFYNCYKDCPSFWFFYLILLIIPNIVYFIISKIIKIFIKKI